MGMFDSVWFDCPNCNKKIDVQSKAGKCWLEEYHYDAVPLNIAGDINGELVTCSGNSENLGCGLTFVVKTRGRFNSVSMELVRHNESRIEMDDDE